MFNPILDWYHQQSQKDQQVLKIGAIAVILGLLYLVLINPLLTARQKLQKDVTAAEAGLQFIKQSAAKLKNTSSNNSQSNLSASQIASSSARKFSITLARIAPKRNNQTSLTIDSSQFNQVISWLGDIQKQGLIVETIDINKVDQVGYVKATITVSGGA